MELELKKSDLVQVIFTILTNAKDIFILRDIESRIINIELSKENDGILLQICDSAGGVDKDNIDKIFEPYFTTKHSSQGTGLGLFMVHEIVQNSLKGEISVYNKIFDSKEEKELSGACFNIRI